MDKCNSTMAKQIAEAASAFEQRRTGHVPKSVAVVLSDHTLVITLHEALSPAERALANSPAGAAQMQEFHRQLFVNSSASLRQEIKRITGVEVRRSCRGNRGDYRHRGEGVHQWNRGASVPARRQRAYGNLERQPRTGQGACFLVLTAKARMDRHSKTRCVHSQK